ncbi:MAG: (2Fe-2S) ferredoxin domain-containing protein [Nitrospinae bacterium]|nr:(2Fe-2S) ferredoxin domain-containing protein [Nitrospinota bacterium]
MPKPKYHLFVCNNKRPPGHPRGCCQDLGSQELWQSLAEELDNRMLYDTVKITGATCVGPCNKGPVVIVYPDNVWYGNVKAEDVKELFDTHIGKGETIDRLLIPEAEL